MSTLLIVLICIFGYLVLAVIAAITALELENYRACRLAKYGLNDRTSKFIDVLTAVFCLIAMPMLYCIGSASLILGKIEKWFREDDFDN
jgi:hypothetical protein